MFMRKIRTMLREAVKKGLLTEDFVKNLDLHEDCVGFNPKDGAIFVAKGYAKWLFREVDKLEIIEVDLNKNKVKVFGRKT